MRIKTKQRFVIVIVDGRSDVKCLKPVISSLYDEINPIIDVRFYPEEVPGDSQDGKNTISDITSKGGMKPETVAGCINKYFVDPLLKSYGGLPADCIAEIIHVIDMDGAYIEDSSIKYDPKHTEKFYYDKDGILSAKVNNVILRNETKRKNIDFLCSLRHINKKDSFGNETHIPYSLYFFSSNLDHVIGGDANLPGREKCGMAERFAEQYYDDPEGFLKAIESKPGTLKNMSYKQSWSFIRERGNNSIEPHTNINILLRRLMEERK